MDQRKWKLSTFRPLQHLATSQLLRKDFSCSTDHSRSEGKVEKAKVPASRGEKRDSLKGEEGFFPGTSNDEKLVRQF